MALSDVVKINNELSMLNNLLSPDSGFGLSRFVNTETPSQEKGDPKTFSSIPLSVFKSYIKSPEYRQRLVKQNVENPDQVIKDRLINLNNIEFSGMSGQDNGSLNYVFTDPNQIERVPALSLTPDASKYTAMHELSHVTNYGQTVFDPKLKQTHSVVKGAPKMLYGGANTAGGRSMSQNEAFYILNRSNVPQKTKENAKIYSQKKANEWGTYDHPLASGYHSSDPSEFKSDLDAVRMLLKDSGITKKFGEDITEETINRAMKDPKVANEPHFIRLMKNFSKKNIVDINNNIAYTGSNGLINFV